VSNPLSILAVTNMYPTASRPTQGIFVQEQVNGLREIGIPVTVFYVDRAGRGMSVYFAMLRKLRAIVEDLRPTLVHVMYGGMMACRATGQEWRCPTIVTFHGSDLLGENFSGFRRKWIARYGIHCSHRAARRADGVIVVSQRLKQALPKGLDESKVRVIPCGINLDRFKPQDQGACRRQLGWEPGPFHVLFPSNNNDPVKRPELAAATVELLNITGIRAELHSMHGVPNPEVPVWMNASDVLLLTSAHEGSPTVVKEALACGLPVVSVDVGDVSERIAGIEGCHIASDDPRDLAARLVSVKRRGGRAKGRARLEGLGVRQIAGRLEGFYRETACRWKGAGKSELVPTRIWP